MTLYGLGSVAPTCTLCFGQSGREEGCLMGGKYLGFWHLSRYQTVVNPLPNFYLPQGLIEKLS